MQNEPKYLLTARKRTAIPRSGHDMLIAMGLALLVMAWYLLVFEHVDLIDVI